MAHAYTPGLTVAKNTTIRKHRLLPLRGEVLVREGQRVEPDTVVARAELPGAVHPVNVVGRLGIRPEEINDYMLKGQGERVERDEPLAETRPWIKLFKTVCRAPVSGTVESISTVTGQVLLREPPRRVELLAYISGRIVEVLPGEGAVVACRAALVQGIFGVAGECAGELRVPVEGPGDVLRPEALHRSFADCVVVCGATISAALVEAARRAGVKALIAGGIPATELRTIVGREIGVAVTGSEQIGLTLVVTEGFGRIPMAANTFALLKGLEGRRASVNGATQIRAGVLRPEIIIPLGEDEAPQPPGEPPAASDGLHQGDQVRVIRQPFFGHIGTVTELVPDLVEIETETRVRALRLRTENGRTLTVPRANVEVITG